MPTFPQSKLYPAISNKQNGDEEPSSTQHTVIEGGNNLNRRLNIDEENEGDRHNYHDEQSLNSIGCLNPTVSHDRHLQSMKFPLQTLAPKHLDFHRQTMQLRRIDKALPAVDINSVPLRRLPYQPQHKRYNN